MENTASYDWVVTKRGDHLHTRGEYVNRDYKGDLNKFAKSLGYGLGKASFSMGDFLADWNDLNQDSLKELIFEYFDGEELGDIYDD